MVHIPPDCRQVTAREQHCTHEENSEQISAAKFPPEEKSVAKSGRTSRAVVASITISHSNRSPQFIDVISAAIGKIRPHGTHQIKAVPAVAKQISVQRSLN
jgi:hypothetical protein